MARRPPTAAPDRSRGLIAVLRDGLARHPVIPALFAARVGPAGLTVSGALGRRKADEPAPAMAQDRIHLGSDTKAFTAMLVGQLVQAGRLAWSDTVGATFADLRPAMSPHLAGVTIRQLLQHTAGLPRDLDWRAIHGTGDSLVEQRRLAVGRAAAAEPLFTPGTCFAYSNVGYVVLGAVIERKLGRPWEAEVSDRLFRPLGMTTAGFGSPGPLGQPWGHRTVGGRAVPVRFDNPPVVAPAGGVHCSMADWGRFLSVYCGNPQASQVLDGSTTADLLTPAVGGTYAGGWRLDDAQPWAGGLALTHRGSNTTWYCVAWVAPARGFAVLAAANSGDLDAAGAACNDACLALIAGGEAAADP